MKKKKLKKGWGNKTQRGKRYNSCREGGGEKTVRRVLYDFQGAKVDEPGELHDQERKEVVKTIKIKKTLNPLNKTIKRRGCFAKKKGEKKVKKLSTTQRGRDEDSAEKRGPLSGANSLSRRSGRGGGSKGVRRLRGEDCRDWGNKNPFVRRGKKSDRRRRVHRASHWGYPRPGRDILQDWRCSKEGGTWES